LVLVGAGIGVVGTARRRAIQLAPLLFLWVYILSPSASPLLALSIAFVVSVLYVGENVPYLSPWLADVVVAGGALALYVSTMAPTILPADSGEFQFVSYVLGIAHPPGYPLYTMLAKLFTFIPLGDVAYRVNLLSAVCSTLALVVLARTVRHVTGSYVAGWIAAVGLGLAPTFWAQSTTANIRSLTALFTALQMSALIAYAHSRSRENLLAFAVALGLGITHHTSLVPLILPYGAFLLVAAPELLRKPRAWLRPGLGFALSLSVLLYLPLRSLMRPAFDPQPIRSLSSFFEHVLALGFRGDMLYFVQPTVFLSRIRVLGNILTFQFGTVWLLLGLWGALMMSLRRWRLLLLCAGVFLVNAGLAVTYRAPQTVEYLMPAYVALALLCAYGAWTAYEWLRSRPAVGCDSAAARAKPDLQLAQFCRPQP
jgi:4-amino-4-deoxy-L-arabinose transferase-like glycosyltransferase